MKILQEAFEDVFVVPFYLSKEALDIQRDICEITLVLQQHKPIHCLRQEVNKVAFMQTLNSSRQRDATSYVKPPKSLHNAYN
jgi:hypothetical protein